MMRTLAAIFLFTFVIEVHPKDLMANHKGDRQDPMAMGNLVDNLIDKFVDSVVENFVNKLFDHGLKPLPLHHADVDNMTLGMTHHLRYASHMSLNSDSPLLAFHSAQTHGPYFRRSPAGPDPLQGESFHSHSGRYQRPSDETLSSISRRNALIASLGSAMALLPSPAMARKADIPSAKDSGFPDYTSTSSGLLFKDIKTGKGKTPAVGDRCVIDWTGYTNDRYGPRPFETKQLTNVDGGDKQLFRFELGKGSAIPAIEEAVASMSEGGLRQLVVEREELGYPKDDPSHNRVGPKPSSFSGERALANVLTNEYRVDRTLFFNIKLERVDKPGENGWKPR